MKITIVENNVRTNLTVDLTAQDAADNARVVTLVSQALGRPVTRATVTGATVKLLKGQKPGDASLVGVYAHTAQPAKPKAEAKPKAQPKAPASKPAPAPERELTQREKALVTSTMRTLGLKTRAEARKRLGL